MTGHDESLIYPLADGTMLNGQYVIQQVLGAGGFGITYLALDIERNIYVVIKECLPSAYAHRDANNWIRAHSPELETMFIQCIRNAKHEAETIAKINHPGVVRVYNLFDANGTFYYVMECIEGVTLHDQIETFRTEGKLFTVEQANNLLVQLLDILQYLHTQNVFHCDIKPGNIFLQKDGTPKLIDFGAVRSKELQHQGLIQITPGYTPPEFYPGRRAEIGPWCDIYGLGATFYELVSGMIPDPADQRSVVDRTKKMTSFLPLRKLYSTSFLAGIDKALAPDIKDRFNSAQAWYNYISTVQSGAQLRTTAPMRTSMGGATYRPKKSGNGVLSVILLILSIGIAAYLLLK